MLSLAAAAKAWTRGLVSTWTGQATAVDVDVGVLVGVLVGTVPVAVGVKVAVDVLAA
jgi:hypothetical protein